MIVADSSTLILITKVGLLDLLINKIKLTIPKKVAEESIAKREADDAKLIEGRIKEDKIYIKEIKEKDVYGRLIRDFNIGKGEAEALTLAIENKAILLTDDKKAINVCKILNIEFTTALNLAVRFYKRAELNKDRIKFILRLLEEYGRYSDDVIQKAMEEVK